MKATNNEQINTKLYWNYIYNTPAKFKEYWQRNHRFFTLMDYIKDGDKFIDLGCGVGCPAQIVNEQKKGCEIWGVDISSDVIKANKKDAPYAKWHQGYIGGLDFLPNNYFDVCFAGELIEHLDNPMDAFMDAHRILKKGGKFVITTPHEDKILSSEHVWFFDQADIKALFKDTGFKKIEFVKLPDTEHILVIFAVGTK
jgi:ubiquinone/menaquinone biosynthesis C-methylase UbiE